MSLLEDVYSCTTNFIELHGAGWKLPTFAKTLRSLNFKKLSLVIWIFSALFISDLYNDEGMGEVKTAKLNKCFDLGFMLIFLHYVFKS